MNFGLIDEKIFDFVRIQMEIGEREAVRTSTELSVVKTA